MNQTPKTIQIFLPTGDPQGIRVAELATRIPQVTEIPRSLLSEVLKMSASKQVAVYFVFGESDDGDTTVYIGRTGGIGQRLYKHNIHKDFWDRALVATSRIDTLTETHATFLECHCLQACRAAGRYSVENGTGGTKPHTPASLEQDCLEIFDTVKTLMATLGYPLFEPVVHPQNEDDNNEVFYLKTSGSNGRGLYTPEGFVVLKGSSGPKENKPSLSGTPGERRREMLLTTGVVIEVGDQVVFQKDHLFSSPGMAALALTGRTTHGWTNWRTEDGTTLDALKRQNIAPSENDAE